LKVVLLTERLLKKQARSAAVFFYLFLFTGDLSVLICFFFIV